MASDNDDPAPPDQLIFNAVITPHRSLSPRGFLLLMGTIGLAGFGTGLVFFAMGAWPVMGFMGLDIALVYWAFRANYRAARARETVILTGRQIIVRRASHSGARAEWTFNPYWTKLDIRRDAEGEVEAVAFVSRGRSVRVAEWLSPKERDSFARALQAALSEARSGATP
ncbi:DUF2244 domain-containing protein [Lutibaculum baratangense]|uniref:Integral membrane protein n=1 Tax=Lutibaculum baratangense AMV1 TaxID=631454 RepID=V4RLA4_9HYPH|nr:DUF2244 domain-containing protein [Lutibaculum baratangense]ESR26089.1 hypothetical protein N177_1424 [Lutibaculum baratangense AMV1]